jgi:HEAT repeat protein
VAKAKKVDAERQAEIIGMLGRQGDPAALPFVRASLAASDPVVVLAAAETLAHVQHAKAAPDLIALLKKAGPETAGPIAGVLSWTIDEKGLDPVAASIDTLQPAARAAAITLIGDKGGKRFAAKVIPLTSDPNPDIRAAAFKALDGVVGPNDLPALLKLLDAGQDAQKASTAGGDTPIADVQKAVVAAASQVTPEDARSRPVLDAMKGAAHPERFIELLPQIGGRPALAALSEQFNGSNPTLKAAAFRGLVQWKGSEAADQLYTIVSSGDASYRDMAFTGFVRQVSSSSLPDAQKVAQLRKAMPFATTARDKRTILRAFERAKSMESFLVVASFLDDKDLANDAAGTVMRIALPDPGAKNGLSGPAVREGLNKVLQVLSGPESDYEKENIRVYLRTMPGGNEGPAPTLTPQEKSEGFVELFNGKTLDGWTGNLVGYKVEDGLMVFDPKAENSKNIYTAKDYSDFVFRFEFQLTPAANSGVGIRAPREGDAAYVGMEIQILDDTAPVYATLQPYQYHSSVYGVIPAKRGSLKPVGEWNAEEIWIKGTKIRITVNGMVTVDGDIAEASQNGTMDHKDHPGLKRTSGAIGFLSHGAVVKFRNIRIKELK